MTLPELHRRVLAERIEALVVVPRGAGLLPGAARARVVAEHFGDGVRRTPGIVHYPNGSVVRVLEAPGDWRALLGLQLDMAIVLAPVPADVLREIRCRLLFSTQEMYLFAPFAPEGA